MEKLISEKENTQADYNNKYSFEYMNNKARYNTINDREHHKSEAHNLPEESLRRSFVLCSFILSNIWVEEFADATNCRQDYGTNVDKKKNSKTFPWERQERKSLLILI